MASSDERPSGETPPPTGGTPTPQVGDTPTPQAADTPTPQAADTPTPKAGDTPTPAEPAEPGGPLGEPDDDAHTSIIRRHPTGPIPQPLGDEPTSAVGPLGPIDEPQTRIIRAAPRRIVRAPKPPTSATAVAASALSIIGGWATAVVATGLIAGWWRTDRLFCVGVGFLTAVFAASTIGGVVGLLLRRRVGIFLTLVGSVLAILIFAGIFVAGAHMAGVVRAIPVLPTTTALLTLAPATWRWTK